MGVIIDIGGVIIDTDEATVASFDWEHPFFSGESRTLHTIDLNVPATPGNNAAFAIDKQPDMPGVRGRMRGTLQVGGVLLRGGWHLLDYNGGRYNLLFECGVSAGLLTEPLSSWWQPADTLPVVDKQRVEEGGILERFGWYWYNNSNFNGSIEDPLTLFPAVSLGYLLREACAAAGLVLSAPAGQYVNPDNFVLVLPTMDTTTEDRVYFSGWAAVPGGTITTQSGSALEALGLRLVRRRYKRGLFNYNKTVYTFEATRGVKITFPVTTSCWVVSGQGYEWRQELNAWGERYYGCTFELSAGEWFTMVSRQDLNTEAWRDYWDAFHGYETPVSGEFYVTAEAGPATTGQTIALADNLPDMSLSEMLESYANMIAGYVVYDLDNASVEVRERSVAGWRQRSLHAFKVLRCDSVKRYVDGWARRNLIECDSADYVDEASRYRIVVGVNNDGIEDEQELGRVAWNEGVCKTEGGQRVAVLQDVSQEGGGVSYSGRLSVLWQIVPSGHINTIRLDGGVGEALKRIAADSVTIEADVLMTFADFCDITGGEVLLQWYGRVYIPKSATWSGGQCRLVLCSAG